MTVKNNISQFIDRHMAGRQLAETLKPFLQSEAVVISSSQNGMPVAWSIASELGLCCDLLISDRDRVRNCNESGFFRNCFPINSCALHLQDEYYNLTGRTHTAAVRNRILILTDEGLEDLDQMMLAVDQLKSEKPRKILVALPVAASYHIKMLEKIADDVVCIITPVNFISALQFYARGKDISKEEIQSMFSETRNVA